MLFTRKFNKIPTFYTTFARILHYVCHIFRKKIFFRDFFLGGATPCPGWAPGLPPAKSGFVTA